MFAQSCRFWASIAILSFLTKTRLVAADPTKPSFSVSARGGDFECRLLLYSSERSYT